MVTALYFSCIRLKSGFGRLTSKAHLSFLFIHTSCFIPCYLEALQGYPPCWLFPERKATGRNVLKEVFESILGYQLWQDKWVNLSIQTVRNVSVFPDSQKAANYLPKYEIEHSGESTFSILKQMSWAFKVVLMFNVCLLYMMGKPILPEKKLGWDLAQSLCSSERH